MPVRERCVNSAARPNTITQVSDTVRAINGIDHNNAGLEQLMDLTEYASGKYASPNIRLAARFKMQLIVRTKQGEQREHLIRYLLETLCATEDSWLQRNLIETVYQAEGKAARDRLKKVLTTCNIDKLVRMRALLSLGIVSS